jgi:hypothetical protein
LAKQTPLRVVLPNWACTRVLRHVRVTHRKADTGSRGFVATGEYTMEDIEPVFQNVRAWGFCLSADGTAGASLPQPTPLWWVHWPFAAVL